MSCRIISYTRRTWNASKYFTVDWLPSGPRAIWSVSLWRMTSNGPCCSRGTSKFSCQHTSIGTSNCILQKNDGKFSACCTIKCYKYIYYLAKNAHYRCIIFFITAANKLIVLAIYTQWNLGHLAPCSCHDFELPIIKYEFNKRNFIVRSLFNYVWIYMFSLVLSSFVLHCTHVWLSYVLSPYLLTYLHCEFIICVDAVQSTAAQRSQDWGYLVLVESTTGSNTTGRT